MFVRKAEVLDRQITTLDDPSLFTYCFHGENTWGGTHFDKIFSKSSDPKHRPSECLKEMRNAQKTI
jgi:hypothetical protein